MCAILNEGEVIRHYNIASTIGIDQITASCVRTGVLIWLYDANVGAYIFSDHLRMHYILCASLVPGSSQMLSSSSETDNSVASSSSPPSTVDDSVDDCETSRRQTPARCEEDIF